MARRNIDVFLAADVEAVIINAAGCGSASKEYNILLRDDPAYAERAKQYSHLCRDVTGPKAAGMDDDALRTWVLA